MRYIKNGAISTDPWVYAGGSEPVPADVPVIVSPDWLLAATADAISNHNGPLGAAWPNDKPVSELAPFLPHLALIALEFPVFRDGRAYSQVRQLRERYGFKGEIRATGDVLRDQFLFMVRAGFDAFEVRKAKDAEAFAQALNEFTILYQPVAGGGAPSLRAKLRGALPSA